MPLGAARLNTISRYVAAGGGGASARASDAVYSVRSGTPAISTTAGQFGGRLIIDSNPPTFEAVRLTVDPLDTNWYFNTNQEWTVEGWVRKSSTLETASQIIRWLSIGQTLSSAFSSSVNAGPQMGISFISSYSSTNAFMTVTPTVQQSLFSVESQFRHFAFVCHGDNTVTTYDNGARRHNAQAITYNNNIRYMDLGMGGPDANYEVWFDDIRISNNQRYTGTSFTVPSTEFTNDSNTLGLFHFNGNSLDDSA